jgi:hypothetical protein
VLYFALLYRHRKRIACPYLPPAEALVVRQKDPSIKTFAMLWHMYEPRAWW